ncbi:TPA: hypothetical protein ACH3X1_010035 [Trebouxia sp. C0004]
MVNFIAQSTTPTDVNSAGAHYNSPAWACAIRLMEQQLFKELVMPQQETWKSSAVLMKGMSWWWKLQQLLEVETFSSSNSSTMGTCRVCKATGGPIAKHKSGGVFGANPLCVACKLRSTQSPVKGGPCLVCQTQVAAGWHKPRAHGSMVCTWCYPRRPRGYSASEIQDNKATSSPEVLTRREAWEEAQVHANLLAVSDAGYRAPIDSTPKVPSAGATQGDRVHSCTAAQAAACKVAVVNHLATMYSESQDIPEGPDAPPTYIQTHIIATETDQRTIAQEARQSDPAAAGLLPGQGTSKAGDTGKKSAASVAEERISEAPCHSLIDGSDHPNQPEDQEENGLGVGHVDIPTAKRSRKRSSVDVYQKGSQRPRRKSAVHEDPGLGPLQTPGLAGVPKPRQYKDINSVTSKLQVADGSPRESQEVNPAVRGEAQKSASADEDEEGATGLLTLRNQDWQQQQAQSHWADQQLEAQDNHDADQLNQQKQLFQAQLDVQNELLRESQQDAADKGKRLAQETAMLQASRLERESYLDLAIQQQEQIFALEQEAVERQQQAAQLQKQQQEEHQQQQVAAALKFKAQLSERKRKRRVSIAKSRKSRENLRTLLANERASAVRQQDMLERLAAAEVKLVKGQMSDVKSRMNRHLCKLQSKLKKNRMTPKQALEWDVKHLEAVLADANWAGL